MNAVELLTSKYRAEYVSPVLVLNEDRIIENIEQFRRALPRVAINYAVKANPHIEVIKTLMKNGCSFEVASAQEIELLQLADKQLQQEMSLAPFNFKRVLYSNPVRTLDAIMAATAAGIDWFVADSIGEIEKVYKINPAANIFIRLIVPNKDSSFPLLGKFGCTFSDATRMIEYCKEKQISLVGVCFHVGSQCPNIENWLYGIRLAKKVFREFRRYGIIESFLDIGGGFPTQHAVPVPSIEEIGEKINNELDDLPESMRIVAEPGRYIVSDAGHLLCQVVSKSVREGISWLYLDTGIFHGMIEPSVGDFKLVYITDYNNLSLEEYIIAGPTCDSLDIVTRSQMLPNMLKSGDFIVQKNVGAYTTAYGTHFNGFPPPKVVFLPISGSPALS